ncbi:hypothetical protein [Leptospira bouyouniensis]|uniref:Phage protein n=1 Tax=Leptospira bouyouniensis TaxID=2484911 RepID=A0ABY2KZ90_9LEPT|nr:hypothetical protein [Leptospira bouyouniensis]TGK45554.1 hypothetical protein EHQ10_19090 [Leptospira bouyouniensis]
MRQTAEIDVKINDRQFKGNVRRNSGIPTKMFFFIWERNPLEGNKKKIGMLSVRKCGKYYFKTVKGIMVPDEEISLLFKLYRFAERHMEIL